MSDYGQFLAVNRNLPVDLYTLGGRIRTLRNEGSQGRGTLICRDGPKNLIATKIRESALGKGKY